MGSEMKTSVAGTVPPGLPLPQSRCPPPPLSARRIQATVSGPRLRDDDHKPGLLGFRSDADTDADADAERPEMWNCGNDGHCQSSIINPIGFLPKMDQDYSGSKTEECQTDVECIGEFRCIAGECVNPMNPKPMPSAIP